MKPAARNGVALHCSTSNVSSIYGLSITPRFPKTKGAYFRCAPSTFWLTKSNQTERFTNSEIKKVHPSKSCIQKFAPLFEKNRKGFKTRNLLSVLTKTFPLSSNAGTLPIKCANFVALSSS